MVESGDKARGSRGNELLECTTVTKANLEDAISRIDGERCEGGIVLRRRFSLHDPPDDLAEDAGGLTRLPGDELRSAHVNAPPAASSAYIACCCRARRTHGVRSALPSSR